MRWRLNGWNSSRKVAPNARRVAVIFNPQHFGSVESARRRTAILSRKDALISGLLFTDVSMLWGD